jgi:hypothetical protein
MRRHIFLRTHLLNTKKTKMKILLIVAVTCMALNASALPREDYPGLRRRDVTSDESFGYSLTLDAPPPKRRHLGKGKVS